ncbi:hypothetical protein ETD83_39205 [Actinomadura soli]|uniref:NIPSNAP family protein n=1 Tax=Actinomadura soli TaxID=2508997 RepID=A0A5C4J2B9_9ACTN|nr:hypothetical protein [Actinomadura soli]TMQ89165.1 hypothetical protein ETD83_39205 [Actinomadura soli]
MHVQLVQGTALDPVGLHEAADRWSRELAPGSRGWLGTTAGVTNDGEFIWMARFKSSRAAHRNDKRRAQREWWESTAALLEGEPTVHDCTDIEPFGAGGSDAAEFVQMIQTRVRDREALRPFWTAEEGRAMAEARPDTIGGLFIVHPDGGCTIVVYFTTEEDARDGERRPMPSDLKAWRDNEMSHYIDDPVFYDLRNPWLYSPT